MSTHTLESALRALEVAKKVLRHAYCEFMSIHKGSRELFAYWEAEWVLSEKQLKAAEKLVAKTLKEKR